MRSDFSLKRKDIYRLKIVVVTYFFLLDGAHDVGWVVGDLSVTHHSLMAVLS